MKLTVNEMVTLLNDFYDAMEYHDDLIFSFDEDTINELFKTPWDALRATYFGDVNFSHNYFTFDGYGNIHTLPDWEIDDLLQDLLGGKYFIEWLQENEGANLTYDVYFNDDCYSNNKGFEYSFQDCLSYIEQYNGTKESYFADYKNGVVEIYCNELEAVVYSTEVK